MLQPGRVARRVHEPRPGSTGYDRRGGVRLIDGVAVEVAIGENPEVLEGEFPGSTIIIMKFEDDDGARNWYFSEGYQEVIPIRHAAADTAFNITFKA